MPESDSGKMLSILTFDLEEWFHILDIDSLSEVQKWSQYEVRIYENTQRILNFLRNEKLTATFFVLAWIGEKYPDLVQVIANEGHEIGCHSFNHGLIYKSPPELFREDLKRSIDTLQCITNQKIRAFRAPGFSITRETLWAFRILAEEGIEVDSSIFPALRNHGGIKGFGVDHPFLIKLGDKTIKEFPINMYRFGRLKIPFSGGGYFRLLPYPAILFFANRADYLMTYFHPRDFDPNQPVLRDIPLFRKFTSYYGIKGAFEKLEKLPISTILSTLAPPSP